MKSPKLARLDLDQQRATFAELVAENYGLKELQIDEEVSVRTRRALDDLRFISLAGFAGNLSAVEAYIALAAHSAAELSSLTLWEWDAASKIASTRVNWPVLLDPHPEYLKAKLDRIRQLGLGMASGFRPLRKKPWSRRTPANAIVLAELQSMLFSRQPLADEKVTVEQQEVIDLPNLSPATAKEWFGVLWKRIRSDHAQHPELDPRLRKLGIHAVEGRRGKLDRTQESRIRGAIRASLWSAFKTIVSC